MKALIVSNLLWNQSAGDQDSVLCSSPLGLLSLFGQFQNILRVQVFPAIMFTGIMNKLHLRIPKQYQVTFLFNIHFCAHAENCAGEFQFFIEVRNNHLARNVYLIISLFSCLAPGQISVKKTKP